ncbi:MAG: hypothetical protein AB1757_06775 [Acidobacteriota bacterium]
MSNRVEQFKKQKGIQTAPSSSTGGSSRVQQFKQQLQQKQQVTISQPTQEEPKKDGFLKSLAKGIVNPFVRTGASLYAAGVGFKNALEANAAKRRGDTEGYKRNLEEGYAPIRKGVNVPFFGNTKVIQKPGLDAAGVGAEGATFFIPGAKVGSQAVKQGARQIITRAAGKGTAIGALSGGGVGLQKEDKTVGSVVKDTTIGAGAGALFGAAAGALSKPAASGLRTSAEKSYSKGIGATTKENKMLSDKVVPELIDRKVTGLTRNTLYNKAQRNVEKAGEALEEGYAKLPKNAQTTWTPVFNSIRQAKEELIVNDVVMDVGRYRALQGLEKDLFDIVGGSAKEAREAVVSVETARKVRQILDRSISQKSKIFGLTGKETDRLAVQKLAANSIRQQLAEDFPDIAKLNKEFTFWSNVRQVVGDTIQRTKSQNPISDQLAIEGGAIAGGVIKGTVGNVIVGAATLKFLKQAVQSTGWRTTSAIIKTSLANSLAKGDFKKANILLQKIIESSRKKD